MMQRNYANFSRIATMRLIAEIILLVFAFLFIAALFASMLFIVNNLYGPPWSDIGWLDGFWACMTVMSAILFLFVFPFVLIALEYRYILKRLEKNW